MKTNTNTELRERIALKLSAKRAAHTPIGDTEILNADIIARHLMPLIDQYVNQKTVEARIDELQNTFVSYDNALASTLVAKPEWEYGQATERIAELQASLNTEGESDG